MVINEIIPAVRVIKMYAWEKPFMKITQLYRKMEMKAMLQTNYLRSFFVTLSFVSSKLTIFPTLVTLVLTGNELTANKVQKKIKKKSKWIMFSVFQVFLIVSLFNNIRLAMPTDFTQGVLSTAETWVSIKRIEVTPILFSLILFQILSISGKRVYL